MRLTFTLEILPVVMFQRRSNCDVSKYVIRQVVIRLKIGVKHSPLWIKRKEDCFLNIFLQNQSMVNALVLVKCEDLGRTPRPSGNRLVGEMACSSSCGK